MSSRRDCGARDICGQENEIKPDTGPELIVTVIPGGSLKYALIQDELTAPL
ncbi:MAG TPA: hypothetical protein VE135_23990 [Pyrinomonadaceae bacterium]|nr:hypothetical protein [Pyrinomonadaceae bacterium]